MGSVLDCQPIMFSIILFPFFRFCVSGGRERPFNPGEGEALHGAQEHPCPPARAGGGRAAQHLSGVLGFAVEGQHLTAKPDPASIARRWKHSRNSQ